MLNKEFTEENMKSLKITRTTNPLTYIPKIWDIIYSTQANNYTFDPTRSITQVCNNYGTYSSGEIMFPVESEFGQYINEEINLQARTLVSQVLLGERDKAKYRIIITTTLKILSHLIPDEDELNKLKELSQTMTPNLFIDYEYVNNYNIEIPIKRLQQATIYGIYYQDKLIYIGQTIREPEMRFREHLKGFRTKSKELKLYTLYNIEDYTQLKFKILFKTSQGILQQDLDNIERALIITNNPPGNYSLPGIDPNNEIQSQDQLKAIIDSTINELNLLLDSIQ